MRRFSFAIALTLLISAAPAAMLAQYAPQLPPPLYIRLAGPPGTKVTIYRGEPKSKTLELPCVVAFRPGYRYRLELTRGSGNAAQQFAVYPSLDVFGSLRLTSGMRGCDHPATIQFTEDDFAQIRGGGVVTKVVVLERPDTAIPIATTSQTPLEITIPATRNPMTEAAQHGRPLAVLQMGERQATPQELACEGVPGTVMLPGETVLPPPSAPPCLPWLCYPLVDPKSGLPLPAEEICFHDGGDMGLRAGVDRDGKLVGLDASDTVVQFTDSKGNQRVLASNVVCLCVPRYLVVRTAISPVGAALPTGLGDTRVLHAPVLAESQAAPWEKYRDVALAITVGKQKASGIINLQQTEIVGNVQGLLIYANAEGTRHVTGKCAEPELELCEKLVIFKWPDKCDLQLGDIVTFYIRYKNEGQRPLTGIIVSDSLTTRLEYVRNSARSDRDALFTMTPNEADSTILRWEVTGSLAPGQTGTVTFQAKVR